MTGQNYKRGQAIIDIKNLVARYGVWWVLKEVFYSWLETKS